MNITIPHRELIKGKNLKVSDFPDNVQNLINRFNEKYNTYQSTKTRLQNQNKEWKQGPKYFEELKKIEIDITSQLTRFLEKRGNGQSNDAELAKRAQALGLPLDASEEKIKEEEQKRADAKKAEDEEQKRAEAEKAEEVKKAQAAAAAKLSPNEAALAKLHSAGKTTVTLSELKAAGFDTGFWGPIGANGSRIGKYRIFRNNQYEAKFTLSKQ